MSDRRERLEVDRRRIEDKAEAGPERLEDDTEVVDLADAAEGDRILAGIGGGEG